MLNFWIFGCGAHLEWILRLVIELILVVAFVFQWDPQCLPTCLCFFCVLCLSFHFLYSQILFLWVGLKFRRFSVLIDYR